MRPLCAWVVTYPPSGSERAQPAVGGGKNSPLVTGGPGEVPGLVAFSMEVVTVQQICRLDGGDDE